jgi:hypothetical protein
MRRAEAKVTSVIRAALSGKMGHITLKNILRAERPAQETEERGLGSKGLLD